jgi:hypothetical protein
MTGNSTRPPAPLPPPPSVAMGRKGPEFLGLGNTWDVARALATFAGSFAVFPVVAVCQPLKNIPGWPLNSQNVEGERLSQVNGWHPVYLPTPFCRQALQSCSRPLGRFISIFPGSTATDNLRCECALVHLAFVPNRAARLWPPTNLLHKNTRRASIGYHRRRRLLLTHPCRPIHGTFPQLSTHNRRSGFGGQRRRIFSNKEFMAHSAKSKAHSTWMTSANVVLRRMQGIAESILLCLK